MIWEIENGFTNQPEDVEQDILKDILNTCTEPLTQAEIRESFFKRDEDRKGTRDDSITTELFRADMDTTVQILRQFFIEVWNKEIVPEDWKKGLIIKLAKKGDLTNFTNWEGITLLSVVVKGRV